MLSSLHTVILSGCNSLRMCSHQLNCCTSLCVTTLLCSENILRVNHCFWLLESYCVLFHRLNGLSMYLGKLDSDFKISSDSPALNRYLVGVAWNANPPNWHSVCIQFSNTFPFCQKKKSLIKGKAYCRGFIENQGFVFQFRVWKTVLRQTDSYLRILEADNSSLPLCIFYLDFTYFMCLIEHKPKVLWKSAYMSIIHPLNSREIV